MTSDQVKILDLEARVEALERAGDALAHDLIYPTNAPVLDVWWKLRRNSNCHVCCPREKAAEKPVELENTKSQDNLPRVPTEIIDVRPFTRSPVGEATTTTTNDAARYFPFPEALADPVFQVRDEVAYNGPGPECYGTVMAVEGEWVKVLWALNEGPWTCVYNAKWLRLVRRASMHFWCCPHYPSAIENFDKGRKACDTCKDDGVFSC